MSDNGNAPPRVPRREAWISLPAEYPGFRFRAWINAPARMWNDINSGDEMRTFSALKQLVLEHNHWQDFDGQPYPQPTEASFWEDIPTELAAAVLAACQAEMMKLPNSIAPQRRRSGPR